jgi:hypothetical protein
MVGGEKAGGDIHHPDAGAGADVEDAFWGRAYGCDEELAVEDEEVEMVSAACKLALSDLGGGGAGSYAISR